MNKIHQYKVRDPVVVFTGKAALWGYVDSVSADGRKVTILWEDGTWVVQESHAVGHSLEGEEQGFYLDGHFPYLIRPAGVELGSRVKLKIEHGERLNLGDAGTGGRVIGLSDGKLVVRWDNGVTSIQPAYVLQAE